MKRDDVGIIYQLNVMPLKQRHLIGATLIKAVFDRAAYGCKLFGCWCAQDIQANYFWESIGFVPLAFRTGSRAKQRIHIYWQKRIREGDERTPYWFPSQTTGGAVGEDRIALPIPPDTHWRDAKPVVLPGSPSLRDGSGGDQQTPGSESRGTLTLPGGALVKPRPVPPPPPKRTAGEVAAAQRQRMQVVRSQSKHLQGCPPGKAAVFVGGKMKYIDRDDYVEGADGLGEQASQTKKKPRPPRAPRQKNDPKYIAAARELRDRYLDGINSGALQLESAAKYEVSRQLPSRQRRDADEANDANNRPTTTTPLLEAA